LASVITFYAYGPGDHSKAGHAFLKISREFGWKPNPPLPKELESTTVFGFYPAREPPSPLRAFCEGKLCSDSKNLEEHRGADGSLVTNSFTISPTACVEAWKTISKWARNPPGYRLMYNDCINFVYKVADEIGLVHDSFFYNFTLIPTAAVRSIHRNKRKKIDKRTDKETNKKD
jgi:hypothetical protein